MCLMLPFVLLVLYSAFIIILKIGIHDYQTNASQPNLWSRKKKTSKSAESPNISVRRNSLLPLRVFDQFRIIEIANRNGTC